MRILLLALSLFLLSETFAQKVTEMPLYAKAIPNAIPAANEEKSVSNEDVLRISKVSVPSITMYQPANPNGKAVIICPGGGYAILAWDKEGTRVATELNKWGVTAFVLKYRLPDSITNIDKSLAPLQDAQQAIRLVRSRSAEWNVRKNLIGIMGFSAGGHIASTAATHFNFKADAANNDTTSVRPDFAILIYPVISMDSGITHQGSRRNLLGLNVTSEKTTFFSNETQVTTATPQTFIVHAGDDKTVPVANSIRFYEACIKNKVPVEMHLYQQGGHSFGMYNKTTNDNWMDSLKNWMDLLK